MGATGLTEWGAVDKLLFADSIARASYSFGRVTALEHRPVQERNMLWPARHDEQLEELLFDGADLMEGEKAAGQLKERVPNV